MITGVSSARALATLVSAITPAMSRQSGRA
jgi:hypothetical protein